MHTPATLLPEKYGPWSQSGNGEEKNPCPCQESNPGCYLQHSYYNNCATPPIPKLNCEIGGCAGAWLSCYAFSLSVATFPTWLVGVMDDTSIIECSLLAHTWYLP